MPSISVAEYHKDLRTTDLDLGPGGSLTVTYKPGRMTSALDAKLKRYIEANDPLAAARVVCEVVTAWELEGPVVAWRPIPNAQTGQPQLDDDGNELEEEFEAVAAGQTVSLRAQTVQYIGTDLTLAIWVALQKDLVPNLDSGTPSSRR